MNASAESITSEKSGRLFSDELREILSEMEANKESMDNINRAAKEAAIEAIIEKRFDLPVTFMLKQTISRYTIFSTKGARDFDKKSPFLAKKLNEIGEASDRKRAVLQARMDARRGGRPQVTIVDRIMKGLGSAATYAMWKSLISKHTKGERYNDYYEQDPFPIKILKALGNAVTSRFKK